MSSVDELIEETQELLKSLGMDEERCNERSARVFLALAGRHPDNTWADATNEAKTVHEVMDFIRERLAYSYAENTRETIRKRTLYQFRDGGLCDYNYDDPQRPTNSQRNNYRICPALLGVIHAIGTLAYGSMLEEFLDGITTFRAQQEAPRGMATLPVHMPDGSTVELSAGGQNILIKQMVEVFCPRFAPGGEVVYIDDTNKQQDRDNHPVLGRFGVVLEKHGKAPDLIVWQEEKEWLFIMEAVSSHGPIDTVRMNDFTRIFAGAEGHTVFVSCFKDRSAMRAYLAELAWETEVWCADAPDHMIHLNGTKFLGPYESFSTNGGSCAQL